MSEEVRHAGRVRRLDKARVGKRAERLAPLLRNLLKRDRTEGITPLAAARTREVLTMVAKAKKNTQRKLRAA